MKSREGGGCGSLVDCATPVPGANAALAEMLRTAPLPASARRSARSELEKAATSSREEALSAFAREALADLER